MRVLAKNKISDEVTVKLVEDDNLEYAVLKNDNETHTTMEYDDAVYVYCKTRNEELNKESTWDGIQ